jgi:hypothetical protein
MGRWAGRGEASVQPGCGEFCPGAAAGALEQPCQALFHGLVATGEFRCDLPVGGAVADHACQPDVEFGQLVVGLAESRYGDVAQLCDTVDGAAEGPPEAEVVGVAHGLGQPGAGVVGDARQTQAGDDAQVDVTSGLE